MNNITSFLQKSFYSFQSSIILPLNSISYQLVKVARSHSYIETLGKNADSLHIWIKKSGWKPKTTIVVCKGIDKFAWIFATNIHFKMRVEYIWYYKRRWQIETNYEVEDERRIKSKSTNHLIRYFYFLVSLLFHMFWIVNKNLNYMFHLRNILIILSKNCCLII